MRKVKVPFHPLRFYGPPQQPTGSVRAGPQRAQRVGPLDVVGPLRSVVERVMKTILLLVASNIFMTLVGCNI